MEKSKSLRALQRSTDPHDKNPLDELFNVLNPSFKIGTNKRYRDRDLPDSFFQQRTLTPKREEAIKKAQIGHFQSLRRRRNPSAEKDPEKPGSSKDAYHRRYSKNGKEKRQMANQSATLPTVPNQSSTFGTLRRKVPEARLAHRNVDSEPKRHGISFKRVSIPIEKVPLPKEWEELEIEIDGEIDRIYQHRTSNIKTRTDPRISIKTHLEELHVTLTAEMISRINNPTAYTQTIDNTPDLDLPSGCRWHQTDRGEVFFINDLARTTSWTHPRVDQQLLQEKLPPLNSRRVVTEIKRVDKSVERLTENHPGNGHTKQVSVDSGVGSQAGSCQLYRQRSSSKVKYRSVSENALLSPQFSIHEKDFSASMSPTSPFSELSSPQSETTMQTDSPIHHSTPVRSTPNLHVKPLSPVSGLSISEANIFSDNEMQVDQEPESFLNEVQETVRNMIKYCGSTNDK